jgi:hypothetical protein
MLWAFLDQRGRNMEFINRYVDQPLLQGASMSLRAWHVRTRQSPAKLEPIWNLGVVLVLLAASCQFLAGGALVLGVGALSMLSLPSAWKLVSGRAKQTYDVRTYRALAALAIKKRDAEWSVRLMILLISICMPVLVATDDPAGRWFLLGASLWFVLTAPVRTYLEAAEPPQPSDGERSFRVNGGTAQFG